MRNHCTSCGPPAKMLGDVWDADQREQWLKGEANGFDLCRRSLLDRASTRSRILCLNVHVLQKGFLRALRADLPNS